MSRLEQPPTNTPALLNESASDTIDKLLIFINIKINA